MDVISRLRAVRSDWGEWTPLCFFPLVWAAGSPAAFYAVLIGAPLLACVAHWLVHPELEPDDL
jgi:hypothetical protein